LSALSFVAGNEGHLEEAESLARGVRADGQVQAAGDPQATWALIALGRVLTERGQLAEAQSALESALSFRRTIPGLSTWPTLVGLLALASVSSARGDRAQAKAVLA
jgi:uncharacterized protein HemY